MARRSATHRAPRWGESVQSQEEAYQRKRSALISEAGKSFRRKGYHNTSLDDIARELNVSKPALYYYVKTKNEILYECISKALDLGDAALDFAQEHGQGSLTTLELFIHRYIVLMTEEHGATSVVPEFSSLSPEHQKSIAKRRRKFDVGFRKMVRDCIDEGQLPEQDEKMAVFFFMGAINSIPRWYQPNGKWSGSEIAENYVRLIIGGLKAPPKGKRKSRS